MTALLFFVPLLAVLQSPLFFFISRRIFLPVAIGFAAGKVISYFIL